jgi:hypothetical protein
MSLAHKKYATDYNIMMVKVLILPEGNGVPKRKFQSRKVVHESVDFVEQNALKFTCEQRASVFSKLFAEDYTH